MTSAPIRSQKTFRPSKIIRSVEDLFRMMRHHDTSHFIYRGEDDVGYKLRPKFGRYEIAVGPDSQKNEISVLQQFRRRSAPHITHSPSNELEWLSLAQHHGLATRLLDWSENPLVATYFATRNLINPVNRVLYALCIDDLEYIAPEISPFEIDQVQIFAPKHISPRISSQMGVFTVHAAPLEPFKRPNLERWIIKDKAVIDIAITLDQIGFNMATMFPGLDGIASHINDWHLRDELGDTT